ncbi:MAG: hypothetical protein HYR97_06220 [Candidatus Melainabacteria bacterium]|nr:hypothetical protein [Candidatus Melainabacteria bacterium]
MKKLISEINFRPKKQCLFIIFTLLFSFSKPISCLPQTILKGSISSVIKKGEAIKINLNTPINFYFSLPGDKVAAFIPKDIVIGNKYYIPKGSRLEGVITNIQKPKRLGIDGEFEIDFSQIITPDKKIIPIHATVSSDTTSAPTKIAKTLSYDVALTSYGALHGALAGVQLGGVPLVISSDGISVLAGAGVGATFGLIGSFARKGKIPSISNIIPSDVKLKNDLVVFGALPLLEDKKEEINNAEEFKGFRFNKPIKKEDITIKIKSIKKESDKKYGNCITLDLNISNNSNTNLNLSDLVLISKDEIYPVHPDVILSGISALKTLEPGEVLDISIAFAITNHKYDYDLVLLDPLDNTEIIKIPLNKKALSDKR